MSVATRKWRNIMALVTFLVGIVASSVAALLLFRKLSQQNLFKGINESGALILNWNITANRSETVDSTRPSPSVVGGGDSRAYGEAGGETDFLLGVLPKMDLSRLREPNASEAEYLKYPCAKGPESQVSWLISIAVVNPSEDDKTLTVAQIAERNRKIRNNETNIERVVSVCSGVLIATAWALTAHHCLSEHRYLKVAIYGRKNLTDVHDIRNFISEIEKVFFYPDYNNEYNQHDIALLKLRNAIKFGAEVQPACLPNSNVIPETGKNCGYAGWGTKSSDVTSKKVTDVSNTPLIQYAVTIEDPTLCQRRYKRLKYDVNYNLCDKTNSSRVIGNFGGGARSAKDTHCSGFSGGPLTCQENDRWVVYGVVNWGEESCNLGAGRGYALVSTRLKWICCTTSLKIPNCEKFDCQGFSDSP